MKKIAFILLAILPFLAVGQTEIPKDYFKNPLEIPIVLAGNFGELRSNHFHSGLDIKTQQRTGLNVVSSAEGCVSRIKVEHYGYGKALYVEHPNGYTTVYGHLSKFSPEIEAYVKANQYEKESYEIELFPQPNEFIVEEGELIAYSGNTGGSGGPHLHFEIRDKQERPMNAMLFGVDVSDTKAPQISELRVYPLSDSAQINGRPLPQSLKFIKQKDGSYQAEKVEAFGKIGFGIATIDEQDGAPNNNGIYTIETSFNGDTSLKLEMDQFSFAETRYLNRMIDYGYFETFNKRLYKLFIERNNPLSIFKIEKNKGMIDLDEEGTSYVYTIVIKDLRGNTTSLLVPIKAKKDSSFIPMEKKETDFYVQADEAADFALGNYKIKVPKGAFYDDYYLDISLKDNVLHLDKDIIPVDKYINISYDASGYTAADREKLYIGSLGYKNKVYYTGARLEGTSVNAGTRTLGNYTVRMDAVAPEINSENLKDGDWMSKEETIDMKITDEASGIADYRATINGNFALMEYEYKKDRLTYSFADKDLLDGKNEFQLIVTDKVGNSSTFKAIFYRKKAAVEIP